MSIVEHFYLEQFYADGSMSIKDVPNIIFKLTHGANTPKVFVVKPINASVKRVFYNEEEANNYAELNCLEGYDIYPVPVHCNHNYYLQDSDDYDSHVQCKIDYLGEVLQEYTTEAISQCYG